MRYDAIVVGAGLAGLVAARRLELSGLRVALLEADSHAGGRLGSVPLEEVRVETGPRGLPRSAPWLAAWLEELDLTAEVRRTPVERVTLASGSTRTTVSTGLYEHLPRGPLRALRHRRQRTVQSWLGSAVDPAAPESVSRLDDRSIADHARVYLGRRPLERLLAPALGTIFGLDAEQTSRELLFTWLGGAGDLEISLVSGLSAIPDRIAPKLGGLRTDARVASIRPDGCGVVLEGGEALTASAVVLAVPAAEALRLLPEPSPAEERALRTARCEDALFVAVPTPDRFTADEPPVAWLASEIDPLFAGSLELDSRTPGAGRLLVAGRWLTARQGRLEDPEIARLVLRAAERLHPGLATQARASAVLRQPGLVPRFEPYRFRAIARLRTEAARRPARRVFLCGDWMVGPHAEGAMASAERAARDVLALLAREA